MEKDLIEYFKDGITIDKLPSGKYSVFTVRTQRFTVSSLDELTPQSFEDAIKRFEAREESQRELMAKFEEEISFEKIGNDLFKGIPVDKLTLQYFKSIVDSPKPNEFTLKNGQKINVGDEYLFKFSDSSDIRVYVHSVNIGNKKNPDLNNIVFVIIDLGILKSFGIDYLRKNLKEFVKIS